MVRQQQFLNRGKVAGMAWPQNASGWQSLSAAEWNAGAEALASVKGNTALVLGVQTEGFNVANSQAYAKKAKSLNADAIISLVPRIGQRCGHHLLFQGAVRCLGIADDGAGRPAM